MGYFNQLSIEAGRTPATPNAARISATHAAWLEEEAWELWDRLWEPAVGHSPRIQRIRERARVRHARRQTAWVLARQRHD